jgi:hypothetical protein
MALPQPPPLPPQPHFEIVTPATLNTARRYATIMTPYIRKINGGPYFIVDIDEHGTVMLDKVDELDGVNNINPDEYWTASDPDKLIEWPEELEGVEIDYRDHDKIIQLGAFDPEYPPVPIEGKWHPGMKARVRIENNWYDSIIRDGPYLVKKPDGTPAVGYLFQQKNPPFSIYLPCYEDQIEEYPENREKRLTKAARLNAKAAAKLAAKAAIEDKLGEVMVPVAAEVAGAGAGGQAFMGARMGLKGKVAGHKEMKLPQNITRKISNYAFGFTNNLERNAASLRAGPHKKSTGMQLQGGRRRRRKTRR